MNQKHRVDIKLLSPFYCPHPVVLRDIYGPFLGKKDVKIGILSILITQTKPPLLMCREKGEKFCSCNINARKFPLNIKETQECRYDGIHGLYKTLRLGIHDFGAFAFRDYTFYCINYKAPAIDSSCVPLT